MSDNSTTHSSADPQRFLDTLKQAGYRITAQRRAICTYLAATERHPTPYQVYADLAQEHPDISRATVYNTLNVLQSLGAIVELGIGTDHTHYDTDPTPHVNLICLRCHTIVDLHDDLPLDELQTAVRRQTGFEPVSARIDLLGFCQACRDKKKNEIIAQLRAGHHDHGPVQPE